MSSLIVPVLNYTARDWERWDTFDITKYSYVKRQSHGLQNTQLTQPTTYDKTYFHMFRQEYLTTFYGLERQYYLWLQKTPGSVDDYIFNLRRNKDFPIGQIVNKISQELNSHYNSHRTTRTKQLREELKRKMVAPYSTLLLDRQAAELFDNEAIDFRKLSSMTSTIKFITELFNLHLDGQCMDPTFTVGTLKPYGTWSVRKGVYYLDRHWWTGQDISFLYSRYIHLLDDELIRRIRTSARASLGALWLVKIGKGENIATIQNIESQWMLRIGAWVGFSYILRRTEDELRLRGVWGEVLSDDLYDDPTPEAIGSRLANRASGQWSTIEAVTEAEIQVLQITQRIATTGIIEFVSAYTPYHFDAIGSWLLHCPSQVIYDVCSTTWRRLQWDLAVNYHPGSASFPCPSLRSYELFTGLNNGHDGHDQYLWLKHIFPQARKSNTLLCVLTSSEEVRANLEINRTSLALLPPNVKSYPRSFQRNFYSAAQLAGEGILPHNMLEQVILKAPTRVVEQRFSLVTGQERYNFITSGYTIGHCGESLWNVATTSSIVARISGGLKPLLVPGYIAKYVTGEVLSSSYIKLVGEKNGTPFGGQPAGNNIGHFMRAVVTQYQGFLLATHLFAPTRNDNQDILKNAPWNSNLILPLGVESLTAGDQVLPMVLGSRLELRSDQLTFTVKHGDSIIVIRLVSYDRSDAHSVVWQVTQESLVVGCGHVVVQHRAKESGTLLKAFKIVWLIGSGSFSSPSELVNLKQLIHNAPIQQNTDTSGVWDESNQPVNDPVSSMNEVGSRRWIVNATVGSLKLGITRTDVYLPWNNSPYYATPANAPLHAQPYFTRNVTRTVQDRNILEWGDNEDPYRMLPLSEAQIFAPHRGEDGKKLSIGGSWQHFA